MAGAFRSRVAAALAKRDFASKKRLIWAVPPVSDLVRNDRCATATRYRRGSACNVRLLEVIMKIFRTSAVLLCLFLAQSALALGLDASLLKIPIELHGGGVIKLEDIVGKKPIYLKFWASWCVPCREQMPHLESVYRKYGNDLEVVSVNIWINETDEAIAATVKEFGLTVPIAIDARGELAQAFEFIGTPYHILIDRDGDIVHKGYEADSDIDRKIELLATRESPDLATVVLTPTGSNSAFTLDQSDDVSVLFFTATWCDWYLEESRPSMSKACIEAQRTVNQLHALQPDLKLHGVATRLWTGEQELQDYIERYAITYPLVIDATNGAFFELNVKTVPTLIVMKNGKEISRTSDFRSATDIAEFVRGAAL